MLKANYRFCMVLLALALLISILPCAVAEGTAQISGQVFIDKDQDGFADSPGQGLSGVDISLVKYNNGAETTVATTISGDGGAYSFPGVESGTYYVKALLTGNYIATPMVEGGSFLLPSSGSATRTPLFNIEGGNAININLGATLRGGSVKLIAFGDENANGGRFSSEPFIRDALVEVTYEYGGMEYVIASAMTNKEGTVNLRNLSPALYRIAVTLPDPYIIGPLGEKINTFYNCIVPSDSNRGLSEPLYLQSGGSLGLGAGGVLTGKAAGLVWLDANHNGIKDGGEGGIQGVKLVLSNPASGVQREIETSLDGSYMFERLQEGQYSLSIQLPEGYMFAPKGESAISSAFSNQGSLSFSVALGQTTNVPLVGVVSASSLSIKAFHDEMPDGIYSEGERPFSGADIRIDCAGESKNIATDENGIAFFPIVPTGEATITCTLPQGQVFSVSGEGENANFLFSDVASSNLSRTFNIEPETDSNLFIAVTLPSLISGTVFNDANISGIYDEGEGFIEGVEIHAVNMAGNIVSSTTSDENGNYTLSNLLPSEYKVRFVLKSPYIFSDASNTGAAMENKVVLQTPEYGETEAITLSPAENYLEVDAAVFKSALVNGSVLFGYPDEGFSGNLGGVEGVSVSLLDEDFMPVSEYTIASTDASGNFSLKGALPGKYYLSYKLPEGMVFSNPRLESRDMVTDSFTLQSSDVRQENTVYAVKTSDITGKVFVDNDVDGKFSEGDIPLSGDLISLTIGEQPIFIATVDEEGNYIIPALRPGKYGVKLTLPEGYLVALCDGSPFVPAVSNSAMSEITVNMGENINIDAAASPSVSLNISSFYDNNLSAAMDENDVPYQMANVIISNNAFEAVYDVTTDENGLAIIPALHIGDYSFSITLPNDHAVFSPKATPISGAWEDTFSVTDVNSALNIATVQFGGLSGAVWNIGGGNESIANVTIELYYANGTLAAKALTGAEGTYSFTNMYPGDYYIKSQLHSGYRYARAVDAANRTSIILSEGANTKAESGQSDVIRLSMGEFKTNQDIGMGAMGQLGDFAWLDLDGDGMQDEGEPGIPDLAIRMYQYGELAAETKTDAYGRYMFDSLYPGEYTLVAIAPTELVSTRRQTEFILVGSILPENQTGEVKAEGVMVPSKARNLNADLGFKLVNPGVYPANMLNLPTKDWTPLVPYEPLRR
ncbi:MAG: hypothetical protein GX337_06270 [Christensenellaceae bacterium]|nr:hypothetical protein [Christensenellaceae bacterium]